MDKKITVVFIPRRSRIRPYKMAKSLKYTGKVRLVLLCEESFYDEELFQGIFDEVHFFTRRNFLFKLPKAEKVYRKLNERIGFGFKRMLRKIKELNPDIIHCFAEPYNHIEYVLKNTKIPVVMSDGADFTGITQGVENLDERTLNQEKFCFENVKGLVYKGPLAVGEYYRKKEYKLNADELNWFDHVDLDLAHKSRQKKSDISDMHFVYSGNISTKSSNDYCYYIPLAQTLAKLKIHLHIYPNPWQYHNAEEYINLDEKEYFFHFHKPLPLKKLIDEISKYDYGLWVHSEILSSRTSIDKMKVGIGNKLFTYIEAGIPVIVSDSRTYGVEVVNENKIGFSIGDKDWVNFREIVESFESQFEPKFIDTFQEEYSLKEASKKLYNFYLNIIDK